MNRNMVHAIQAINTVHKVAKRSFQQVHNKVFAEVMRIIKEATVNEEAVTEQDIIDELMDGYHGNNAVGNFLVGDIEDVLHNAIHKYGYITKDEQGFIMTQKGMETWTFEIPQKR